MVSCKLATFLLIMANVIGTLFRLFNTAVSKLVFSSLILLMAQMFSAVFFVQSVLAKMFSLFIGGCNSSSRPVKLRHCFRVEIYQHQFRMLWIATFIAISIPTVAAAGGSDVLLNPLTIAAGTAVCFGIAHNFSTNGEVPDNIKLRSGFCVADFSPMHMR